MEPADHLLIPKGYALRPASLRDVPHLQSIESSAGGLFHTVSLSPVASDPPMSLRRLSDLCNAGGLTVATVESTGDPVAFLAVEIVTLAERGLSQDAMVSETASEAVEESAQYFHIAELSTHAQHQRQGLGSALLQSAIVEAKQRGMAGLSLTTYVDVPFNAPFYRRFGFQEVSAASVGPEFAEILREELECIHAPSRRCFMLKKL